jgi:hypothetical protein
MIDLSLSLFLMFLKFEINSCDSVVSEGTSLEALFFAKNSKISVKL